MADGAAPLTVDEVERLMRKWYLDLLDTHAPADQLVACLDENVDMRYPEATFTGTAAFRDWYDRIVTTYFDEVHEITKLEVSLDGDTAVVDIMVDWQAKVWVPPAAKSVWIGYHADQTHHVRRSPATGEPGHHRLRGELHHPHARITRPSRWHPPDRRGVLRVHQRR